MLSPLQALKMNKETTEVSDNNHHLKVFLPKKLVDSVPKCAALPKERLRWNTNEEIASYLITFEKHEEWLSCSPKTRPQNGSVILYNRKKVKYRKDGYCWKKRKDGKTTREDHMKLKVKGVECLYGCYVHSSIVPTFHRRCYWLLQNPDIVLVHYLNVPAIEDCGKVCGPVLCSINSDRKEWLKWSKEELVGQLKPMFHGIKWTCNNGSSTAEFSIEQLVQQILESHQAKPPPRTHACLCSSSSSLGSPGHVPHKCSNTKHRIISPKVDIRPCTYPALTEVQNISGTPEAKLEPDVPKPPGSDGKEAKVAKAASPATVAEASPDSTQPSPGQAQGSGFPKQELPAVTLSVGLPGSAILVMTGLSSAEKPLALTPSQHLVSGEGAGTPTAPLGLTLLPGPGLVLSQNLDSTMETNEVAPAAFDPDCFLNSPKQGQTYGGGAGLQGKPEPPETSGPAAYCLYMATNRFFIQDDGSTQVPAAPSPPTNTETEGKNSPDTPMETIGEGNPPEEETPGQGGEPSEGPSDMAGPELQEELYSMMQTAVAAAAAASGSSFGLSFDSHFPDLINELLTEEGVASVPHSTEGAHPESQSPGPVLPAPAPDPEPSYAAEGVLRASPQPLASITDFSPEWSYPEGGVKVLITGPWMDETESYSCLFDQISVPASLIQSGVLRCYCPAHEAGLVPLQVAHDFRLVSMSVLFEYRARNLLSLPSTQLDWLSLDDNQFRMSILERLEQMEKRLAEMTAASAATPAAPQTQQRGGGEKPPSQAALDCFEERIVALCEKMMVSHASRLRSETLVHHISFRGMTLLHLAAAQGYTHLIETLIKWRSLNAQSLDLEQEVDPLNVDHFSCTPLMWACALGHLEAAQLLYRWNSRALSIPDSLGRLPLTVARSRGHVRLATCLEEMQRQEESPPEPLGPEMGAEAPGGASKGRGGPRRPAEALRIPSPLSASPDTGLSTASGVSSPSELSEGSISITSAYSSGSALRESPAYSPEAEGAMDVCQAPGPESVAGWYLRETPSPQGLPHARFFIDYSEVEAAGHGTAPQPDLEPELLGYGENTENEEYLPTTDVLQVDMVTLAKQIIEATPERIKQEDFSASEAPLRERPGNLGLSDTVSWLAGYLENVEQLPSFSQRRSLASSPTGHACLSPLHSPLGELSFERLPPPPTAASWAEFLNASGNGKMESDFALLTLSDHEQRELYEAAKIIQTAFRKYKGRRLKEQQEMAAAVIQRCYRKYKQYALYKKMTQAAILIQSKFRSYYEQKRFQQSRRAAVLIQQYYRSYKEYEKLKQGHRASAAMQQKIKWIPRRLAPPERGTFLTKKQDQAARKIMRFLRRCRHRMKELKQQQEGDAPSQKRGVAT